ncbi:MAG: hypothetical protein QHC79_25865 [Pseudosphingobacterium sp.]|nr:hypothetical protein [Pseudosphingobacterium sp.]
MSHFLLLTGVLLLLCGKASAQIYTDPAVAGATAAHSSVINGQLNRTNDNLTLIQRGQLALTGQLTIANDLQNKLYRGLSEVSAVLRSLLTVKDIATIGLDIVEDAQKAINYARDNPLLLLFAEQGAREFRNRATSLAAEVSSFVLSGGENNLMDSGERAKLLLHIRDELIIIRSLAFGMQRSMFYAKQRGLIASLNPYAGFINIDRQIADDILRNANILKQ